MQLLKALEVLSEYEKFRLRIVETPTINSFELLDAINAVLEQLRGTQSQLAEDTLEQMKEGLKSLKNPITHEMYLGYEIAYNLYKKNYKGYLPTEVTTEQP